ncbi:putative bifunctional diguanylate cyclase/phosphodiesterase [Candidatus Formimonas warabiya]|uniref:EAL domain-containing protein n=1 Tax=Formimonas warabiya TaxID=1761012 RepID=A0A3G1KUG5_FORW1|nr:bifunctional diguanylate cyclase/phosphodiesterase [Candidatus Formimonas warabiya]ATW26064.1 hypothetical protein DCMF_15930 [Candidatus Formimonas warabiya]
MEKDVHEQNGNIVSILRELLSANAAIRKIPFKISFSYLLLGVVWIFFSDNFIEAFVKDRALITPLQTYKGWIYVTVSACLIYLLTNMYVKALQKSGEKVRQICVQLKETEKNLAVTEDLLRTKSVELDKTDQFRRLSEERYKLAIEGSNDGLWDWDIAGDTMYYSDRWKDMLGYGINEVEHHFDVWRTLLHPEDAGPTIQNLTDHLAGKTPYYQCEHRLKTRDGTYKWILARGKAKFNGEGKPVRMAGSHTDITERKNFENRIHHLAFYDTITNMPNRAFLQETLTRELAGNRDRNRKFALMYLDLDNFKSVNDTLGHLCGDQLLRQITAKIKEVLPDHLLFFRFGGDEFVILFPDIRNRSEAGAIAEKILQVFEQRWTLAGKQFYITASAGITVFPDDGTDEESLLRKADTAMYRVKKSGKNTFKFYSWEMDDAFLHKVEMENELRYALEKEQMVVYYQPIIDAVSGRMSSMEALVRWNHPVKGLLAPYSFIDIAEETGLVVKIDQLVLKNVCRQLNEWRKRDCTLLPVAVNLSAQQFESAAFLDMLQETMGESALPPGSLEFEITEVTAIKDLEATVRTLNQLKEKGFKISLDDFGTGYSSLNYLRLLPIHTLKIDRSFIRDITDNVEKRVITETVVSLAHKMNLTVVAEGVETKEQFYFLRERHCDKMQGFFFSKALAPGALEQRYLNVQISPQIGEFIS